MRLWIVAAILTLTACRGEPVPPDYQNAPPDATNPPATQSETPAVGGSGQAAPEPTTGVEGMVPPHQPTTPESPTTTLADTPPTST